MPKRVCVIGAGAAGLTATKSCLEEGHQVVCYERTEHWGGLWRYRDTDVDGQSSVMRSTIINTSKETSAFSDYPPPKDFPNFMHNRFMVQYFEGYAKKFGLLQHIRYNHEIQRISPKDDFDSTGRWVVRIRRTNEQGHQEEIEEVFDGVMICTGHHAYPNMPQYPGLDSFGGKVIHTHGLKDCDDMLEKNVIVVGTGNSGVDAAVEASMVARQVYLSTRRGFWLLYRVGEKGRPFDAGLNRRFSTYFPTFLREKMMEAQAEKRVSHEDYRLRPKHSILSQHPTMSDVLPNRIQSGTVQIKGRIRGFTKNGVIFDGEDQETPLDVVIFATGYSFNYPFLDKGIAKVDNTGCELYEFVFPPHLKHPTLAFIGLIQPIGPIFPVQEMQSRWYASVLSGKTKLPSEEVMRKSIKQVTDYNAKHFISGVRHITEVVYIPYLEKLAKMIGVNHSLLWLLLTDPKLFMADMFGPFLPYNYRLKGPHAWAGARDAILGYEDRVKSPLNTRKLEGERVKGGKKRKLIVGVLAVSATAYLCHLYYPDILDYVKIRGLYNA